jgi:hypothetical protein
MTSNPSRRTTDAWIITDALGRIQAFSPAARGVLGGQRLDRGDDLPGRFGSATKALRTDMEVALTGWPTDRTVVLDDMARGPVAVRFRVSRKLSTENTELFWLLGHAEREKRLLCA